MSRNDKSSANTFEGLTEKEASTNMLTAINNALNDHQFMNAAINTLGAVGMLLGLVVFYLALTYERRFRKR
jgi:hypothetical protein